MSVLSQGASDGDARSAQTLSPRKSSLRAKPFYVQPSRKPSRARIILTITAFILLIASRCPFAHECSHLSAHAFPFPMAVHMRLSSSRIRIEIRNDIKSGDFALALREQYDRNGDKQLDSHEREALADYLELSSTTFMRTWVDDSPISFKRIERRVSPLELPLPSFSSIYTTLILEASWPRAKPGNAGPKIPSKNNKLHRVRFMDRHKDNQYPISLSLGLESRCSLQNGRIVAQADSTSISQELSGGQSLYRNLTLNSEQALELDVNCNGPATRQGEKASGL